MEIMIKNVKSNKAKHIKANEKLKKQVKKLKNDLFAPTLSFWKFEILKKITDSVWIWYYYPTSTSFAGL